MHYTQTDDDPMIKTDAFFFVLLKISLFRPHNIVKVATEMLAEFLVSYLHREISRQEGSLSLMPFDRNSAFCFSYRNINDISFHKKNINK